MESEGSPPSLIPWMYLVCSIILKRSKGFKLPQGLNLFKHKPFFFKSVFVELVSLIKVQKMTH